MTTTTATTTVARGPGTRVAVVAAGAAGTLVREALASADGLAADGALPWGTLAANLVGTLLLGVAVGALGRRSTSPRWLPLTAGLLGATTTFSGFAAQSGALLEAAPAAAAVLLSASVGGGLLLVSLGHRVGAGMARRGGGRP